MERIKAGKPEVLIENGNGHDVKKKIEPNLQQIKKKYKKIKEEGNEKSKDK